MPSILCSLIRAWFQFQRFHIRSHFLPSPWALFRAAQPSGAFARTSRLLPPFARSVASGAVQPAARVDALRWDRRGSQTIPAWGPGRWDRPRSNRPLVIRSACRSAPRSPLSALPTPHHPSLGDPALPPMTRCTVELRLASLRSPFEDPVLLPMYPWTSVEALSVPRFRGPVCWHVHQRGQGFLLQLGVTRARPARAWCFQGKFEWQASI